MIAKGYSMNALPDSVYPPPPTAPQLVCLPGMEAPDLDPKAIAEIIEHVHQRYGIVVPTERREAFSAELGRIQTGAKIESMRELSTRLRQGGAGVLELQLAEAASVNHTSFCREPDVLGYFEEEVLKKMSPQRSQRVWSAAASSGEEAYTIAMMACEHFGPQAAKQALAILGTDINRRCVDQANEGYYSAARVSGVPLDWRQSYFKAEGHRHRISEVLRSICLFRRLNLKLKPWPFQAQFDVIFCRNVLYYFDVPQQSDIAHRLYRQLKVGGWLFTSVTEGIRDLGTKFVAVRPGVYRKESP